MAEEEEEKEKEKEKEDTRPTRGSVGFFFSPHSDLHPLSPQRDIHLHCNKWDEALRSGKWEPQEIVEKLPDFLKFVKKVQELIMADQETHMSHDSE